MKVTMDDVARMAGVSKATVSRVVNNIHEGVGQATRMRVLKIIQETNYRTCAAPNQTQQSKTLGLIIPDITFGLTANGVQKEEAYERACRYLDAVGLQKSYINKFPNSLSGGQRQRVAVARALAMEPRIILADEPVSALDKSVQAQVLNLFQELQDEFGISILFISHDLSVVEYISDHIAVLYLGEVIEYGTAAEIYSRPRHPYTRELLSSIPKISADARLSTAQREPPIELPSPIHPPSGCRYHPRCPYRTERCSQEVPHDVDVEPGHRVKCHLCFHETETLKGKIK